MIDEQVVEPAPGHGGAAFGGALDHQRQDAELEVGGELMLADALREVAMIRRARLSDAASILGSWKTEVGTDRERLDRLDRYTDGISRLLVGQYELLRAWVEDEGAANKLNDD